ncbi:hypothetical protein Bbelb_013340 [Branchiostoma belcheri]|nr:hypothetical protein Bbelb_013340 [Branchiostoma belcheri]
MEAAGFFRGHDSTSASPASCAYRAVFVTNKDVRREEVKPGPEKPPAEPPVLPALLKQKRRLWEMSDEAQMCPRLVGHFHPVHFLSLSPSLPVLITDNNLPFVPEQCALGGIQFVRRPAAVHDGWYELGDEIKPLHSCQTDLGTSSAAVLCKRQSGACVT